jgi:predicted nucleic acid-binding protein
MWHRYCLAWRAADVTTQGFAELGRGRAAMIGLDTNVVVRYLTQDDPVQSSKATELIERGLTEEDPGFVSVVAMAKTAWVLERIYGLTAEEMATAIERVRDFLARRHKIKGRGTHRFSYNVVYGERGCFASNAYLGPSRRVPHDEASRRAVCRKSARPVR